MWAAWGDLWAFADPVSIDGQAKTIRINPDVAAITTIDIYSAWVRWAALYDQLKYLPAMRTVGLDTLPGGQFTGLFVFLMHGWQIVTDHNVTVDGILYHDDAGVPAFDIRPGGGVTNKVAALAYGVNTAGSTGPTAAGIAAELLAQLQATNIPVNVKQVNGVLIQGAGVAGNPMRPV